jgi:hypothetical protein
MPMRRIRNIRIRQFDWVDLTKIAHDFARSSRYEFFRRRKWFNASKQKNSPPTYCVGVSLWVRSDNARAIAFYEKVGMVKDPGGPVSRDQGATHLTMRKIF